MRIAIVGTRGIPAAYGGFETFAEELSGRLAARGHEVTVYCRRRRVGKGAAPEGVRRVYLPCFYSKYLETVSHTALSALHATVVQRYDAVILCNAANAVFAWLPRLRGTVVALNVDGLERNRRKWNRLGRAYYSISERVALRSPNRIVSDARVIQRYYKDRYGADSTYIPYGAASAATAPPPGPDGPLARFGIRRGEYVLYVSRLEPENHAHTVAAAFARCPELPLELVITGNAPYADEYVSSVTRVADDRTIFTGGVYGAGYRELQAGALFYVHATAVGGVHPALIEAMATAMPIVCADTPENREVLGESGLYYPPEDVDGCAAAMRTMAGDPELRARLGDGARRRAEAEYSWERVTDDYEALLADLSGFAPSRSRRTGS